jgi:tetratricopeptide (TPR) repeat protein
MAIPQPQHLRIIIAQSSYRKANRIRQTLVLAGYNRDTLYEVIAGNECWQALQDHYPIHLLMVSPVVLLQLNKTGFLEKIRTIFPEVALLLLPDEDGGGDAGIQKILPDAILTPPMTAEALENGIHAALDNRERRDMAKRYIGQGERALEQGRLDEAQENFQEAVRISGRDPYPCYALGELLARIGNVGEAINSFIQSWEREPANIAPIHRIVDLYLDMNNVSAAILYLEYAVQHGIALITDRVLLAVLYFETGAPEKCASILRVTCGGETAQAIPALVEQAQRVLEKMGEEASIALLQIGRDIFPENTLIYAMLGDLYTQKQQLRDALGCYEHLVRLGEPLPESYCRLAKSYLGLGYPLRAEQALHKALELDPECQEAMELRAAVL